MNESPIITPEERLARMSLAVVPLGGLVLFVGRKRLFLEKVLAS